MCDLILNTVSAPHELENYIPFLRKDGTLVQLGLVVEPHQLHQMNLLFGRKKIAGWYLVQSKETKKEFLLWAESA